MSETFINIDFFRTLISVLIGGLISLGSVLIIESLKIKKERKTKKRTIYNGLISIINTLRRIEMNLLEHGIYFNYHKTIFKFDKDEKAKEQAVYHQLNKDNKINKIIDKSEQLDLYKLDYKIHIGEDKKFDELMRYFEQWPRPESPNYSKIETIVELNKKLKIDQSEKLNFTKDYWYEGVVNLDNHISKKLL
jgi:hypothetical protein